MTCNWVGRAQLFCNDNMPVEVAIVPLLVSLLPLPGCPLGRRLDFGSRKVPCILSPASCQTADDADRHVLIASDLATKPDSRKTASLEHVTLGHCHAVRLALDEFDAAGRAACIPT